MTDLLTTLPSFPTAPYTHLLPSLERSLVTTSDLLTLDALEIAKRAQLPILDVKRLANHILEALHGDLGFVAPRIQVGPSDASSEEQQANVTFDIKLKATGQDVVERWNTISLLDDKLDEALSGGIPTGYITEVTGESGTGKTQVLLTLLLSTQLPPPHGLSRSSIYISTESGLPTTRLTQLLNNHPTLSSHPAAARPSLSRILAIRVQDLEEQDHILAYQLPVAIKRHNAGLVIIDSVTANFRAEHGGHQGKAMASRSAALVKLGHMLRKLAREENIAVVVANQVSDRFESATGGRTTQDNKAGRSSSPIMASFSSPAPQIALFGKTEGGPGSGEEMLSLDHQQRFFSGWGDESTGAGNSTLKTPALGLVWTNQIACRIALKMSSSADRKNDFAGDAEAGQSTGDGLHNTPQARESYIWSEGRRKRVMRVVFAPWVVGSKEHMRNGDGPEFEILREGIKAVMAPNDNA